jgi:GT2 family glycosyltransferase
LAVPRFKLSVVIVSYNVAPFLVQTIETLQKSLASIEAEVWMVDNASTDESVLLVQRHFPWVKIIANKDNLGFSKANNQAIRQCDGEFVLLLNPDIILGEQSLTTCLEYLDAHKDVGGLGVHMLDGGGYYLPESKRGLSTPWVAFCKVFGLTALFPSSKLFARYYLGHLDELCNQEVEILSGAFMMMRGVALEKSGLLDETFFMYGEDIDLSYRLLQAGFKNVMLADTRIIHYKGESTKRGSANYVRIFYKAMIIFADKHFGKSYAGFLNYLINVAIYLRATVALFQRFFRVSAPVIFDSGLIFSGMYFLKEYWERNHKGVVNYYPSDFIQVVVPIYIATWLISVYYSGGYDKPARPSNLSRGIIVGTVLIAAVTNFFDDFRFSKALILMGGAWAIFSMIGWRALWQLLRFKNLDIGEVPNERIAIMGSMAETKRAHEILIKNGQGSEVIGYLNPEEEASGKYFLGNYSQLINIWKLYSITELVFCLGSMRAESAIQIMENLRDRGVKFRTLPATVDLLIGSKTKGEQGDWYSTEDILEISKASAKRDKRLLDVFVSLSILVFSPLLILGKGNNLKLYKNSFQVLVGSLSWVGVQRGLHKEADKLRPGILKAHNLVDQGKLSLETKRRLHYLYVRDYEVLGDLKIILKNLGRLSR